ncbi:MAG: LPS-assembly protein LptD, partial [Alistipes sp.]|nr:LPS-assembly protein LptD [Alistipes sp.]
MKKIRLKYLLALLITLFMAQSMFGFAQSSRIDTSKLADAALPASDTILPAKAKSDTLPTARQLRDSRQNRQVSESNSTVTKPRAKRDSTSGRKLTTSGLSEIVEGKNTDSLYYDVVNRKVYIYNQGDIKYADKGLQADFMRIDMNTKEIYAYGKPDSVDGKLTKTQPVFTDNGTSFTMDTINYNFDSEKALIQGVATQQGDGWLVGGRIKKQPDNSINIQHGKYTTCEHTDHPHFYLAMTKAKVIPGKKIITGPAYLVMEDVPIYPLCIPEGFFPISSGAKSGLLMPTYGEDASRGFFLRGMGYYFIINQHLDLALTGGFYTLGSWEVNAASRYIKRYKYSGNLNFD